MAEFSSTWHVGKPTGACAATGVALAPGTTCIATLSEIEGTEDFHRSDYSESAWTAGARPERCFSFWRTVVPDPGQGPRLLVDDAVLEDLFERLAGDERPKRIAFRYVLSLILMRRRRFRHVGRRSHDDGTETWLLRPRGVDPASPPTEVMRPVLGEDDVRDLGEALGEILRGDL